MNRKILGTVAFIALAVWQLPAQDVKTKYPNMAPIDQYMMERDAEIAMARSAAPESISQDAEVMIMGRHGYETAVKADKASGGALTRALKFSRFTGKSGEMLEVLAPERLGASRIHRSLPILPRCLVFP